MPCSTRCVEAAHDGQSAMTDSGPAHSGDLSTQGSQPEGRREDGRLLRGRGRFTSDACPRGSLHAIFVRSPYAHALIGDVDLKRALSATGIVAAYAGSDLMAAGVSPIPGASPPNGNAGQRRALAVGRVRFEGEAVAIVIAESADAAAEAARLVDVSYDPLPFATDVANACEPGAPTVYDDVDGNLSFSIEGGDDGSVQTAFDGAHRTVRAEIRVQRVAPPVLEPRACAAQWNAGLLTVHTSCENPHVHRLTLAECLPRVTEQRIRVRALDTGGAFGARSVVQPETVAICWAARALDRPVCWTASREETFLTDSHGGDHLFTGEVAFDPDHRITALRARLLIDLGSCLSPEVARRAAAFQDRMVAGPYHIPAVHTAVSGYFSHTAPVGWFRGSAPDPTFVLERLLDLAARELGEDPVTLRRTNLSAADNNSDYGVHAAVNRLKVLDEGLDRARHAAMREVRPREQGRLRGSGIGCYSTSAAGEAGDGPEGALVRVHPTGRVTVCTGRPQRGEGHETTYAEVAAAALGVEVGGVTVVGGDTDMAPFGVAGPGSAAGAYAVERASQRVAERALEVAAGLLGVGASEVRRTESGFEAAGGATCSWSEVAGAAYSGRRMENPGLEAVAFGDPPRRAVFGVHLSEVEIDPETGTVTLRRHVAWDDCSSEGSRSIRAGQLHGAIVQGMTQALWSRASYGPDGRLHTRSFSTFAMARPHALPVLELFGAEHSGQSFAGGEPSVEGAAMAAMASVVNAVMDAVRPLGVTHVDTPLTAEKIWQAMRSARSRQAGEGRE